MAFGVFACPHCRRVQAAELRFASVRCRSCARPVPPGDRRLVWRGDDEAEARAVVQRASAQQNGMGIEEYAQLLARMEEDRHGSVDEVLAALAGRGEFGRDEFEALLRARRVPGDAERLLERLAAENRVYEPRPGRFRLV